MCRAEPSGVASCLFTPLLFQSPQINLHVKLHTSKFKGKRLKAACALTVLYSMQLAGYVLYVSMPYLHAIPSCPKCFGCPPANEMQCTLTALFCGHPLTFRNADAQSNVIGLCKDLDIFNLNNPQDVFCI